MSHEKNHNKVNVKFISRVFYPIDMFVLQKINNIFAFIMTRVMKI